MKEHFQLLSVSDQSAQIQQQPLGIEAKETVNEEGVSEEGESS